MNGAGRERRSPLTFFVLAFVLAIPFYVLGTVARAPAGIPMDLPWAALAIVCPIAAALILVYREEGMGAVARLLKRIVDHRRIRPIWYLPILLLVPAMVALASLVMRLLGLPSAGTYTSFLAIPVLFAVFFVGALAEETGWTGYAIDPMQARWGALVAAVLLGLVWAVFHLLPWVQVHGAAWSVGYAVWTVAARVLIVWVYNNTGRSLLAAILFHDTINTSASVSPYVGSPVMPYIWAALALVAVTVVGFGWGPRTLTRRRSVSETRASD